MLVITIHKLHFYYFVIFFSKNILSRKPELKQPPTISLQVKLLRSTIDIKHLTKKRHFYFLSLYFISNISATIQDLSCLFFRLRSKVTN